MNTKGECLFSYFLRLGSQEEVDLDKLTEVTVTLSNIPCLASQPIVDPSSVAKALNLFVKIRESDLGRFNQALRHRNLVSIG